MEAGEQGTRAGLLICTSPVARESANHNPLGLPLESLSIIEIIETFNLQNGMRGQACAAVVPQWWEADGEGVEEVDEFCRTLCRAAAFVGWCWLFVLWRCQGASLTDQQPVGLRAVQTQNRKMGPAQKSFS